MAAPAASAPRVGDTIASRRELPPFLFISAAGALPAPEDLVVLDKLDLILRDTQTAMIRARCAVEKIDVIGRMLPHVINAETFLKVGSEHFIKLIFTDVKFIQVNSELALRWLPFQSCLSLGEFCTTLLSQDPMLEKEVTESMNFSGSIIVRGEACRLSIPDVLIRRLINSKEKRTLLNGKRKSAQNPVRVNLRR